MYLWPKPNTNSSQNEKSGTKELIQIQRFKYDIAIIAWSMTDHWITEKGLYTNYFLNRYGMYILYISKNEKKSLG